MKKLKRIWVKTYTKTLRILAPNLALKVAKRILFKPKSHRGVWTSQTKTLTQITRYGKVKIHKYGKGKCIWLIHDWSGSGHDFWPLMQKLEEKGYSTITFDFPAHGQNQSQFCSLPKMINVFNNIANSLFEPHLVIAHGMGAAAVANSQWFSRYSKNLLLVSPVLDTYKKLLHLVNQSGFDNELFDQAIHQLYCREKMLLPELNATPKLNEFEGELKILHEYNGDIETISMNENLTRLKKGDLVTIKPLGYKKIIKSQKIINMIESYNVPKAPVAQAS